MATLMIERYSASDPDGFGPSIESFVENFISKVVPGVSHAKPG